MSTPKKTVRRGTWYELRIHPATLTKMVIEQKAIIVGKNKAGVRVYELR